jgi:hypothetical protein
VTDQPQEIGGALPVEPRANVFSTFSSFSELFMDTRLPE